MVLRRPVEPARDKGPNMVPTIRQLRRTNSLGSNTAEGELSCESLRVCTGLEAFSSRPNSEDSIGSEEYGPVVPRPIHKHSYLGCGLESRPMFLDQCQASTTFGRELYEQAAFEQDPNKLLRLVRGIDRQVEEKEQRLPDSFRPSVGR